MRPTLLYISVNDGTDTRIFKEIKSLSSDFDITFIGVITHSSTPSMLPVGCHTIFIHGLRRSPLTIAKLFFQVAYLKPWSFKSIHVINENLALILYPLLLLSRHWVLDVFDSLFLKSASRLISFFKVILQRMIYSSADVILVTDDARLNLLPAWSRSKARVLPNYPLTDKQAITWKAEPVGPLKIFFSGSIGVDRGLPFLLNLIKHDPQLQVQIAGWLYDQAGKELCKHPQVTYHGIIHQSAAAQIAKQCDYILCLYEPNIVNNIYASPNKIYDGIQAGVPVIINQEVLVSAFVRTERLGYVLESYNPADVAIILEELKAQRGQYGHISKLHGKYTWEVVEPVLINAHLNN
jgi:hypothetical protein